MKDNPGKLINKIDMDDGNYPYAKDIGRVLAKTRLNNTHRGIIDAVLDKTYGWNDPTSSKKQRLKQRCTNSKIEFKYFEEFTGTPFCKLSVALKELVKWKIIKREKKGRSYIYSFNVMVEEWDRKVFKKRFQQEGWGKVYQVVNNNSLPNGKVINQNSLPSSKQSEKQELKRVMGEKEEKFTNQESLPDGKVKVYQSVNSQFTNQETKNREDASKNTPSSDSKETYIKKLYKETIHTTKWAIPDIEFCRLKPEEKKQALDILVKMHFRKFPYSKSPDRKIRGKQGFIGFVARTRDYFEGIFEKYPTLSPKKIEDAIKEAKDPKPWKYYPEKRASKERYLTQEEIDAYSKQRRVRGP